METVTGGDVTAYMALDGIPIYKGVLKICELVTDVGRKCPIPSGALEVVDTVVIPPSAPKVS